MTDIVATPLRGPALHAYRIRAAQIALYATCKRATELGFTPLLPAAEAQAPYDLVLVKHGVRQPPLRVQVKHRTTGVLPARASGTGRRASERDFDFYALYVPAIDRAIFVPVVLAGATIATEMPNSATPFYWWKDFDNGPNTRVPARRNFADFGVTLTRESRRGRRADKESGTWPDDAMLLSWVEEYPMTEIGRRVGVSETAVRKRIAKLGAQGHPRGYWSKRLAARSR